MLKTQNETALAVGVMTPKQHRYDSEESFSELKSLLDTAGANLVGEEFVELRQFNPATLLGQGRVEQIAQKIAASCPDFVVVDAELSPTQNKNLEAAWGTRVVDRTGLILDIFAQRATSKEGKLQVELAQYHYLLPRLVGQWTHLSKQRGGSIGLRGPGETQLEVDRRRVRERITQLKKNLKKVSLTRQIHRQKRMSVPMPTISLIGYTNAGKSTLFNRLVDGHVVAEDKLFSTLDSKTQVLKLNSGQKVLLSDTVGFIRNLPHQLIESFQSTFEEVAGSDLLLHVIDVSHPNRSERVATVEAVLRELHLDDIPVIKVLSKSDLLQMDEDDLLSPAVRDSQVRLSSITGVGISDLLQVVEQKLSECYHNRVTMMIPHADARALNHFYTYGRVLSFKTLPEGYELSVTLPDKWLGIYHHYVVEDQLSLPLETRASQGAELAMV